MITTNQQDIQLGVLKLNEPHKFKYTLRNEGTSEAKIVKIVVGCGSCTVASMITNSVAAGGSADLDVTFTPNSTGLNAKSITVFYTINGQPVNYSLKFKATVV